MQEESYPFTCSRQEFRYKFVSVSEWKKINKIVLFTQINDGNSYSLALFDILEDGLASASVESNNGDERLVLATVIKIIDHFLSVKPDCLVIFRGSDARRHRLYRVVITRELPDLSKTFQVYGIIRDKSFRFKSNGLYEFYMIRKL
ncbi:DUF6934 family protein [Dyadobacter bucti]|uniref:DUF6934 family protein n=1 Tax=Dyadobacter bucti TaxID=2572203 RepID=UPI003F6F986D